MLHFMKAKDPLLCPLQPIILPYSESDKSNPHRPIIFL